MLKPDAKITINMDKQTVKIVENADIIDDPGQPVPETV